MRIKRSRPLLIAPFPSPCHSSPSVLTLTSSLLHLWEDPARVERFQAAVCLLIHSKSWLRRDWMLYRNMYLLLYKLAPPRLTVSAFVWPTGRMAAAALEAAASSHMTAICRVTVWSPLTVDQQTMLQFHTMMVRWLLVRKTQRQMERKTMNSERREEWGWMILSFHQNVHSSSMPDSHNHKIQHFLYDIIWVTTYF